jgi:hypothetical protein
MCESFLSLHHLKSLGQKRFVLTQKISVLAGVIGTRQHYGERGVGFTPASSKGLVLAGNISHPPAQMDTAT